MRTFDNGVWTSELAATRTQQQQLTNIKLVYKCLQELGDYGATDQEIETLTGMPGNSERPARRKLVKSGKVCDSGRWRLTRAGSPAIVWVVVF